MSDWAVALVLLIVSAVLIALFVLICRLLGFWRLTDFVVNDEKTRLNTLQQTHYTETQHVSTPDTSHTQIYSVTETSQEDHMPMAVHSEPSYANEEATHYSMEGHIPEGLPPPAEPKLESPVSEAGSVASELETIGTGLQRAMSCDSVTSDSSIMTVEPEPPKIGQLEFAVEYDREHLELVVSIIQARDLEPDQITETLNSFVKMSLSPRAAEGSKQTSIVKGTTCPEYMERFPFKLQPLDLDATTIQYQVFSSDRYARHKLLGETELRLGDVDLRNPLRVWMNLRDMDEPPSELGDVMMSLSYLPTAERLTVVIVKARKLKWSRGRSNGACFVKVYLLQNGKRISKKKTSTKRSDRNPIFNEAMIFSVPSNLLQNIELRISVLDHSSEKRSSSIGHIIVGPHVTGTELTHWNQMMTTLRKPVAMWHRLKKYA